MGFIGKILAPFALAAVCALGLAPHAYAEPVVILGPGDGITFGSPSAPGYCSVAAVGEDDAGRLIGLTAGHCIEAAGTNTAVYKVGSTERIGTTTPVFNPGSLDWFGLFVTNNQPDYGVIVLDRAKVQGTNASAVDAEGQSVTLTGLRPAWQTTGNGNIGSVCSAGYTTKIHCSEESHGIIVRSNLINAYPSNSQGDSGGALVDNQGQLLGILTGKTADYPPNASTRIDRVLEELAETGSYGAGFELL